MTEQSEEFFSLEVSDEALEIVGHAGKEKSKFTLGYCTALDTCPHEPTSKSFRRGRYRLRKKEGRSGSFTEISRDFGTCLAQVLHSSRRRSPTPDHPGLFR